ncbi:MAG: AI-2E family transporter [Patescibacteria group bacterium]
MDKQVVVSVKTVVITLLILLGGYVIYSLRSVIGMLLLASLIVVSMEQPIGYFKKFIVFNKPVSRSVAVLISYALFIIILLSIFTFVLPPVVVEFQKLMSNLSTIVKQLNIPVDLQGSLVNMVPQASKVSSGIVSATISVFSNLATFVSLLIFSIYMSLDWENLKKNIISLFPRKEEDTIKDTIEDIEKSVGNWIRGQVMLMLSIGIASAIGLSILGVKYAIGLGLVAGIFELVPLLGPTISAILAGIIGFADSPIKGIGVVALFIVIQQLENNILVPKIMEKVSGFRPLVILLALLVGTNFFGILGAVCAVPMLMVLTIIFKKLIRY